MYWRTCLVVLFGLQALANARPAAASTSPNAQRAQFLSAYGLARRGQDWSTAARGLEQYPLWSYLETAALRHDLAHVKSDAVAAFITNHPGHPQSPQLRQDALLAWAKAGRWSDFSRLYDPASSDGKLKCHAWTAIHQAQPATLEALREAAQLWRNTPKAESACAPAFTALEASGQLGEEHRLQRIQAAFAAGDLKLVGWLLPKLSAAGQVWPTRELKLRQGGSKALTAALAWQDEGPARTMLSAAIARLAVADPRAAEVWRLKLANRFSFGPAEQLPMQRAIALAAAIDDLDEAAGWLQRMAVSDYSDPKLYEWAIRYWLGRGRLAEAEVVLLGMPAELLLQPRWRYLQARVLELNGKTTQAQSAYALIAGDTGFYPFLAADRLDRPYAICPAPYQDDPVIQTRLLASPNLVRALELKAIGFKAAAAAELKLLAGLQDAASKPQLAAVLKKQGWYAEAIALLGAAEFQRYYSLRYPRPWARGIDRNAHSQRLDPAWTSGLIRAESAFDRFARSSADARGLMQMLPGTARQLNKHKSTPDLYAPAINLQLGTRYLRMQLDRFGGDPLATTAAYNAGPGAVQRWLPKPSRQWRDLWVETIPYFETREYVARVLAFSVIYDWRDDGKLTRLSTRLGLLADSPVTTQCP